MVGSDSYPAVGTSNGGASDSQHTPEITIPSKENRSLENSETMAAGNNDQSNGTKENDETSTQEIDETSANGDPEALEPEANKEPQPQTEDQEIKDHSQDHDQNHDQDQDDVTYTSSIRYQRLQQISEMTVAQTLKLLSYDKLSSCYPQISSTPSGQYALQQALTRIGKFFETATLKEIQVIFEERDIARGLKELENVIEEAKQRKEMVEELQDLEQERREKKQSTEHTTEDNETEHEVIGSEHEIDPSNLPVFLDQLTPSTIIQSHLLPLQQAHLRSLETQLDALRHQNGELISSLTTKNEHAQGLLQHIEAVATDLKEKGGLVDEQGTVDGRQVEQFLRQIVDQVDASEL